MYLSQITDPDSIFMARKTSENFRNLSVIVFVLFIFWVQKNGLKVGCLTIFKIYFYQWFEYLQFWFYIPIFRPTLKLFLCNWGCLIRRRSNNLLIWEGPILMFSCFFWGGSAFSKSYLKAQIAQKLLWV